MSKTGYYVAYPTSEQLHKEARLFIQAMLTERPVSNTALLAQVTILFVNETIDAYLMDLLKNRELKGVRKRLLETTDSIIKKTAHTVIKQVARKLDINQQVKVARRFDSCLIPYLRNNLHDTEFVAYPISEELHQRIRADQDSCQTTDLETSRSVTTEIQKLLFDQMVAELIEKLLVSLKLSTLQHKIVRIALNKCIGITHATYEKLFSNMTEDEINGAIIHQQEMLITLTDQQTLETETMDASTCKNNNTTLIPN